MKIIRAPTPPADPVPTLKLLEELIRETRINRHSLVLGGVAVDINEPILD